MQTLLISNVHRSALALPYIEPYRPLISLTPDYPYYCAIGHFRCLHGHTSALDAYMTEETALVVEDDCVPDQSYDWKAIIDAADRLIINDGYDIVCLHGRGYESNLFDRFDAYSFSWLKPNTEHRWVLGTLCYVISRKAAKKFIRENFWVSGYNIDLYLWSKNYNFCMIEKTPFIHERCQGSLLENPRHREYVTTN